MPLVPLRPNEYYPSNQMELPIVSDRFEAKQQIAYFFGPLVFVFSPR